MLGNKIMHLIILLATFDCDKFHLPALLFIYLSFDIKRSIGWIGDCFSNCHIIYEYNDSINKKRRKWRLSIKDTFVERFVYHIMQSWKSHR